MSPSTDGELGAGVFSVWLGAMLGALRGERSADVPCGTCTACCSSSQFVHIAPDETDTLRHIPKALLFPAPRMPRGHVLMGYDEHGRCPMLVDEKCTIYVHRPRTCRIYDCRVFSAAGIEPDEADKALIREQVRRWRFDHPSQGDQKLHDAVESAASMLRDRSRFEPDDPLPVTSTQTAVAAVELHELFVRGDPGVEAVRVELRRRRR